MRLECGGMEAGVELDGGWIEAGMWRDGGWGRVKCRLLYSVYCTVVEFYGGGGIWEVGLRYILGCRLGKGGRVEGDEDV